MEVSPVTAAADAAVGLEQVLAELVQQGNGRFQLLLALTRRRNSWSTFSRYRTSSDTLAADTTTETPEVAR